MKQNYIIFSLILFSLFSLNENLFAQRPGNKKLQQNITSSGSVISGIHTYKIGSTAAYLFSDNMDSANDTVSLAARGYLTYYRGTGPQGSSPTWFTGVAVVFTSFNGPDTGYVAADYLSVQSINDIDNWLVLPALNISTGDTLSFFSRSPLNSSYPDSIRVMYSSAGDSVPEALTWVEIANFKVNTAGIWEQKFFTAPASGANARFAIRYNVVQGGPFGNNADYIGIDQIDVLEAGTVGLSEISAAFSNLLIYPVPVKDAATLIMYSNKNSTIKLSVSSLIGSEIYSQSLIIKKGENLIRLEMSKQSSGIYFIAVTNDESRFISKFVKE
ncbi:MAG: choice-of-anchor J domain-containing protein [Bacteroidia bacterium]